MDVNPFTSDYFANLLIAIIGALLGIGHVALYGYLKWMGGKLNELGSQQIVLIRQLDAIPVTAMQSEIKSSSENIRVLDRNLNQVDSRVKLLERDMENVRMRYVHDGGDR